MAIAPSLLHRSWRHLCWGIILIDCLWCLWFVTNFYNYWILLCNNAIIFELFSVLFLYLYQLFLVWIITCIILNYFLFYLNHSSYYFEFISYYFELISNYFEFISHYFLYPTFYLSSFHLFYLLFQPCIKY